MLPSAVTRVSLLAIVDSPTYEPHISPHGREVKCPDDETNEQCILRAPAITLSDHRAVYDANAYIRKGGRKVRKGVFFCGCPLWTTPKNRAFGQASKGSRIHVKNSV